MGAFQSDAKMETLPFRHISRYDISQWQKSLYFKSSRKKMSKKIYRSEVSKFVHYLFKDVISTFFILTATVDRNVLI